MKEVGEMTPQERTEARVKVLTSIQTELSSFYTSGLNPSALKLEPRQAELLGFEPGRKGQELFGVPVKVIGRFVGE